MIDCICTQYADKPVTNSIWNVIIPIIIGAFLAYLAQWRVENLKNNRDRNKRKNELIALAWGKTYMIDFLLKALAMYKTHKKYYYRASVLEIASPEDAKDSFDKHYEKGQEQRIAESKLAEQIAEFFKIVIEYSAIVNKTEKFKPLFNPIYEYAHPKPSNFEKETLDSLVNALKVEEERLNVEYKNYLKIFKDIQHLMV